MNKLTKPLSPNHLRYFWAEDDTCLTRRIFRDKSHFSSNNQHSDIVEWKRKQPTSNWIIWSNENIFLTFHFYFIITMRIFQLLHLRYQWKKRENKDWENFIFLHPKHGWRKKWLGFNGNGWVIHNSTGNFTDEMEDNALYFHVRQYIATQSWLNNTVYDFFFNFFFLFLSLLVGTVTGGPIQCSVIEWHAIILEHDVSCTFGVREWWNYKAFKKGKIYVYVQEIRCWRKLWCPWISNPILRWWYGTQSEGRMGKKISGNNFASGKEA